MKMLYNGNTRLTDILAQYPWLPDELIQMDARFKIIKTPIGKMMIKNATVKDMCEKTGLSEQVLLDKLDEMVKAHTN
jgi:hypothetical protein